MKKEMETKEVKAMPQKFCGYYYTMDGTEKKQVNLGWFIWTWENGMPEKDEACRLMEEFVMGYAMTEKDWRKQLYANDIIAGEYSELEKHKATLGVISETVKNIKSRIATARIIAKSKNWTADEKYRRELKIEAETYVLGLCKKREGQLKRKVKKLESVTNK